MKISHIILSLVSVLCFSETTSVLGATTPRSGTGLRGRHQATARQQQLQQQQQQRHLSVQRRAKMGKGKGKNSNYPTVVTDPRYSNSHSDCTPDGVCVTIISGHTAAPNNNPSSNPPPQVEPRSGANNNNNNQGSSNQQQQEFGTGTRSIAVSVNYNENPEDVAWSLFEVSTGREILHSNYEEVTQPGIVTKQADGVAPGPYQLLMYSLKGRGISCGSGFCVEVVDMTGYHKDEATGEVLVGGTVLFEHNGGFGPMLMEEFNLY